MVLCSCCEGLTAVLKLSTWVRWLATANGKFLSLCSMVMPERGVSMICCSQEVALIK